MFGSTRKVPKNATVAQQSAQNKNAIQFEFLEHRCQLSRTDLKNFTLQFAKKLFDSAELSLVAKKINTDFNDQFEPVSYTHLTLPTNREV